MRVAEYCSCDKIVVQRRSEVRGAKVCDVSTIFDEVGGVVRQVLQRRRPRSNKKHGEAKNAGKLPKHFRDVGARAAALALEFKSTPATYYTAGALDLALAGICRPLAMKRVCQLGYTHSRCSSRQKKREIGAPAHHARRRKRLYCQRVKQWSVAEPWR